MKTRQKRAQITLFVLVGIIIVLVAGFLFYAVSIRKVNMTDIIGIRKVPSKVIPVKNYVDECLKQVTPGGIYLLAAQGGYISSFAHTLNSDNIQVAYHMDKGDRSIAPSEGFMRYELSRHIEGALKNCINNFEAFEGYEFEYGEMEVDVTFSNYGKIKVDVYYPITVITDDSRTLISDFSVEYPVRIKKILDKKDGVLEQLDGNIGFDVLSELSGGGIEFNILPYGDDSIVYSIYDAESAINDVPFYFNFGVKIEANSPPRLEFLRPVRLEVGEVHRDIIETSDGDEEDELTFSVEEGTEAEGFSWLDVNLGQYLFDTSWLDAGIKEIHVCVTDGTDTDCDVMRFNVVNG